MGSQLLVGSEKVLEAWSWEGPGGLEGRFLGGLILAGFWRPGELTPSRRGSETFFLIFGYWQILQIAPSLRNPWPSSHR